MKLISVGLKNHIKHEVTSLCSCWKITRSDGVMLRFTDLDRDLSVAGETYKSTDSYDRGILKSSNNIDTDEMKITGVLSLDGFGEGDLRAGVYDHAELIFFLVNWMDPGAGVIPLRRGKIGEVTWKDGAFTAEFRGLSDALRREVGDLYTPECRARFCDPDCGLNKAEFEITDVIAAVSNPQIIILTSFADGSARLDSGLVVFTSGANAGRAVEIESWDAGSREIRLFLPLPHLPAVGDTVTIYPGCDKRFQTCRDVYENQINFRGFPHIPGTDNLLSGTV